MIAPAPERLAAAEEVAAWHDEFAAFAVDVGRRFIGPWMAAHPDDPNVIAFRKALDALKEFPCPE
jgi:hypothetical protein